MSAQLDGQVAAAVTEAAEKVAVGPSLREQLLEDALVLALEARFGSGRLVARRKVGYSALPDWSPQPYPFDVGVLDEAGALNIAFELKVTDINHTF